MADQNDVIEGTSSELSRRDFVALSVAGVAAATAGVSAAGPQIIETDVAITTPDGVCDCAFIYPATGRHAAEIGRAHV